MKQIALSEAKDQLSKYLHDAEKQDIVILRHGKPAGVLPFPGGRVSGHAAGASLNLIDSPQPQASATFGLRNLNPACKRSVS